MSSRENLNFLSRGLSKIKKVNSLDFRSVQVVIWFSADVGSKITVENKKTKTMNRPIILTVISVLCSSAVSLAQCK